MNETATADGKCAADAPIEEGDAHQQPPPTSMEDGPGNDHSHPEAPSSEPELDVLLSHVVPPSHILADGRFIQLPPPSAFERAAFFERAVAAHGLISCDGEGERSGAKGEKRKEEDEASAAAGRKKRKGAAVHAPAVHPLAIASARIRAKGTDELSKAINLGGLVMGGEYFGVTNIVDPRSSARAKKTAVSNDAAALAGDSQSQTVSDSGALAATPAAALVDDHRFRAAHALRKRHASNAAAASTLARHAHRLTAALAATRVRDARLRGLRRRWRLAAPEHGTRTTGPIRPREVVAVDVEVYGGGERGSGDEDSGSSARRKISRRVPRFATVELDDDYDAAADLAALRQQVKGVVESLKNAENDSANVTAGKEDDGLRTEEQSAHPDTKTVCKTKAEPFAIADPMLGKTYLDFNLTLLFEIEKPSTGFVECATLSSSFAPFSANNGGNTDMSRLQPDERVIEALQHSLFCASLFEETMRPARPQPSRRRRHKLSVAWLSSETEESFLPPPAVMTGGDAGRGGDVRSLCVIHCHEGEVKLQLDNEYSLTVKLIEAGTAAAAAGLSSTATKACETQPPSLTCNGGSKAVGRSNNSGSQSPAQLKTLCRALLLHSQSLYHKHRMESNISAATKEEDGMQVAAGFARTKKENKAPSPPILQSCVAYGCKFVFEKKLRGVLKRVSRWLAENLRCPDKMHVAWLPLAPFDSHSRFALLFRDVCLDVGVAGNVLRVTQAGRARQFRALGFGSDAELEGYLKLIFRKALVGRSG